jgi:uncharacterized metal-binding protein YceD (DUF177 family)
MTNVAQAWTMPVAVADVADGGSHYELSADSAARESVAKIAGLRALPSFEASFDLVRRGDGVAVRGEVRAAVEQTCVVTLEPIENKVQETVDLVFAPTDNETSVDAAPAKQKKGDPPEPLENGMIDLGALATEFLILGLDPYPRKAGTEFARIGQDRNEGSHPFAGLAALKKQPKQ